MNFAPLLTALLAWLAFPSVGVWPLAFVAWAPLLYALARSSTRQAFLRGWLAGAAMNGLGGSFVYTALLRESGLPSPVVLVVFVAFGLVQGLPTAIAAWLARRAADRGWGLGPAFVLAATGLEVASPLPLPWSFAASVSAWTPIVQIADVGGATAVSAALFATNASLAGALDRRSWRARARSLGGIAILVGCLAYGAVRVPQVEAAMERAPRATVGVAHTVRRAHDPADSRALLEQVNDLGRRGADLVVTSESSIPGILPEADLDAAVRIAVGDRATTPAIFGATIGDDAPTNSALTVEGGAIVERYDKHRLLPFAEYLPFEGALPFLRGATRAGRYRAGTDSPRRADRVRAATSICYEDTLAEVVRAEVRRAPTNLLVNLTNDAWFEGSSEPDIHFALARLRAVELRRTLLRSANLGRSAIVSPTGSVLAELGDDAGGVVADVPLLDAPTIYQRLGEGPGWGALGLALALASLRSPRARAARGVRRGVSPSAPS